MAVGVPAGLLFLLLGVWRANLATASLVQLTGAVVVALVGGVWPALLAAVWSSLLLNYFMAEPHGTLVIHDAATVVSLLCFVLVSGAAALAVDVSARRAARARRAGEEAAVLNRLALVAIATPDPVQGLLEQMLEVFDLEGVALFVRQDDGLGWQREAAVGHTTGFPGPGETTERINGETLLVLRGRALNADELRLLKAFAAQATAVRAGRRLADSLQENKQLSRGNRMRESILHAVSHDLRTPLAGIKLAVDGLLQPSARFSPEESRELLETIQDYADRLGLMVENLLDMSRIRGGAVGAAVEPVQWRDVLPQALAGVPADALEVDLAGQRNAVAADAGLVERVVANLVENAVRYAPTSRIVLVARDRVEAGGRVFGELRVVDTGQDRLPDDLEELFRPFQRFTDSGTASGIGLGLAVARGLAEAMGGTLHAERTRGGGLTMVLLLPLAIPSSGASRPSGTEAR